MRIETKIGAYQWVENWATIPDSVSGKANGRTHGIVVSRNGSVILFHQADPAVVVFSPQGEVLSAWGSFPGAHGLTLVEENGEEFLWLVDEFSKEVVKADLRGRIVQSIPPPAHAAYGQAEYIPTWLAVNEKRFGGNGDLWLADGYGASLIHRFDAAGKYLETLDGTEGAGRFNQPHGIALDTRRKEPEIYIADRGNRRFQVYGVDGRFRRAFGDDFLTSPDVSVPMGDLLLVPELTASLSILDKDDRLIAQIGRNDEVAGQPGWPNERNWIVPGKFNSPHSAACDAAGNIYVVEWILGGRITKLARID